MLTAAITMNVRASGSMRTLTSAGKIYPDRNCKGGAEGLAAGFACWVCAAATTEQPRIKATTDFIILNKDSWGREEWSTIDEGLCGSSLTADPHNQGHSVLLMWRRNPPQRRRARRDLAEKNQRNSLRPLCVLGVSAVNRLSVYSFETQALHGPLPVDYFLITL